MPTDPRLGLNIFLIEDEPALLMLLEDMLDLLGCSVSATASTLQEALDTAKTCTSDVAIVDLNLGGRNSIAVAEALKARQIPIVFSTGYGARGLGAEWADCPVLAKPYATEDLAAALQRATGHR